MENGKLFDLLNNEQFTPQRSRAEVVAYLKQSATELTQDPDSILSVAYDITGLLATNFAAQLPDNDPVDEILTIAGEIESNPPNVSELCHELIEKIAKL